MEIRKAHEVGKRGNAKMFLHSCESCAKQRWVPVRKPPRMCVQCTNSRRGPNPAQSLRQLGKNNPSWKGGIVENGSGYRCVLMQPDDPFFGMANKTRYAMEHRLVMARSLGRPLARWEQVHHLNGIRSDNRIENLELWKLSQPSGVRQCDYHCPGCRCKGIAHD